MMVLPCLFTSALGLPLQPSLDILDLGKVTRYPTGYLRTYSRPTASIRPTSRNRSKLDSFILRYPTTHSRDHPLHPNTELFPGLTRTSNKPTLTPRLSGRPTSRQQSLKVKTAGSATTPWT